MKNIKYLLILLLCLIPMSVFAYQKSVVDITNMSIVDLSESLDKGYLTSELLVQLYLERIDAYDKNFNSIREINPNALEEAKKLDQERANGSIRGPLHGIPIVVKTNIDVLGIATTAGAKSLKDNYPKSDATVVQKLKDAGAIILASTNMSEFAFQASTSVSSYGTVKNAFNPKYTPNGSSGGSAVAVATSFAAASLGTDTNSSVRLPASAAGLVGLRPTLGLISSKGVIPYDLERDTVGILTKTVSDNSLILDIIAENKDYKKDEEIDLSKLKIGVINGYVDGFSGESGVNKKTDASIAKLTHEKLKLLSDNGIELVYIDKLINSTYENIASSTMTGRSFCTGFNEYIKNTTGTIRSFQALANSSGHIYSLSGYLDGCSGGWKSSLSYINSKKKTFENQINKVMTENDVDIIVYPTMKVTVLKIGETKSLNSPGSSLGSVIGYPSITVPMGYIDEFSYGLEIFSTKYSEDTLYAFASYFEELNDLKLVNSPLTPSLYEVPEYIDELISLYEENYDNNFFSELTAKTKEYFKNYSANEDELDLETKAYDLIGEYKELKIKEEKSITYKIEQLIELMNNHSDYVLIGILALIFLYYCIFITKRIKRKRRR